MIHTVKMLLRKEWEVVAAAAAMIHLTFSRLSLVRILVLWYLVWSFLHQLLYGLVNLKELWFVEQVVVVAVVVAEDGGRDVGKMLFTLSRSLWRIFISEHLRSFLSRGMSCAQSAVGRYHNSFGFD